MSKINWSRLIIGGVVATIILFMTDGVLHEHLLHPYWEIVYDALGAREATPGHGVAIMYFLVFELGRGFLAILLYVLMRSFTGAGAKTAVMSAVVAWLAFSVAGPAQFIPLGFYSKHLWLFAAGAQLVTSVAANLLAAWLYKDPKGSSE